jgi:hypothetical protein
MSARDEGYLPWIAANPGIFQFDAIMDVRVAAVRPTQTSWRSRRPVRHERFNSARACELRTSRPVKECSVAANPDTTRDCRR